MASSKEGESDQERDPPRSFINHALLSYVSTFWHSAEDLFDPVDCVVAAYPPLRNDTYYALQFSTQLEAPQRDPGAEMSSCAESVQTLALWLVWAEKNALKKKNQQEPSPRLLDIRAPDGLTLIQMRRRLQRLKLEHFPIYEYSRTKEGFTLVSGKPREDLMSIIYLPKDEPQLPVAHWTFGAVVHEDEPEQRNELPQVAYAIYSKLPFDLPNVFWRADVVPENAGLYHVARTTRPERVCDCDWRIDCEHMKRFGQEVGAEPIKITVDGARHVHGSRRGVVVGTHGVPCTRVSSSAIRMTLDGHAITLDGMAEDLALIPRSPWYGAMNFATTNRLLEERILGTFDVGNYMIRMTEILKEGALLKPKLPSLRTVVVATLAATEHRFLRRVTHVEWTVPERPWGAMDDLKMRLPRKDELLARLALREDLTAANVLDTVRRLAAEEQWRIDVDRAEFRLWLSRIVEEKGKAMMPQANNTQCWTCRRVAKTYRHQCRACKSHAESVPPESLPLMDTIAVHVGFRPLWSKEFVFPHTELKNDVVVRRRKHKQPLLDVQNAIGTFRGIMGYMLARRSPITCRGYLRGPMFLSQEPSCFPRGDALAVLTFLIRLGAERKHEAQEWFYELCWVFVKPFLQKIDPESWAEFESHFSGEKLLRYTEARRDICNGWLPAAANMRVRMQGFIKAEKSYSCEYSKDYVLLDKPTEKPRFICSPLPLILARMGPWTHAQTKWLARRFPYTKNMFYAGCASPEQLHDWLNRTLDSIPEPWTIVDDITAIDANHSSRSFDWHKRIRGVQFPHIHPDVEAAYEAERNLDVRVGLYKCKVGDVNASGVADTSYKNSMICLIVRSIAVLHAFEDIRDMSEGQFFERIFLLRPQIFTAASGDDGLVRMPNVVLGNPIARFSIERYQQAWAWAGFSVKVALVPPVRWRMATFLAMRPVWSGQRYEWAPEPARRLRGMFWQIDNTMHPIAWARGVASQVLQQSLPVPVLSHVCEWYLRRTTGPIADVQVIHGYSPFAGLKSTGQYNDRAVTEFCVDYRVTIGDIERFTAVLEETGAVLVNLDSFVLQRIFAEES